MAGAARMTRVLQLMAGAKVGGAESFFERLVCALARTGLPQAAVIRRHEGRAARLAEAGLPVHQVRFGGPLDLLSRLQIRAAARRFAPDIVLAWMSRAASMAPHGPWTVVGRLGGYYDLKYYRGCQHLVGNTRGIRDHLVAQGWPSDRAWYLPNFVDASPQPAVDRAELDTPADATVVLLAARLHPNKGIDAAIAAMTMLPAAHLWIAGTGPLEASLRRQAADAGLAGRVHFLGWRDDLPALLAASDCLLCASRHEPLGNVVLEGWAHDTPVVAASAQGPSELIENERTGLLVPVDDAKAMAAAVARIADDPSRAASLAAEGQDAYSSQFSEAAVVARYCEFFEKVAA